MKQDNMSMAASIESRVPYLDHVLAEYALQIPAALQVRRLTGKQVLKSAARCLLPREVIEQRKKGFPTPWRVWLRSEWMEEIQSLLLAPRSQQRGIFHPEAVRVLFLQHRGGVFDHSGRIWRLLNLELWMRVFVDADSAYCRSAHDRLVPDFPMQWRSKALSRSGPTNLSGGLDAKAIKKAGITFGQ